MKFRPPELMSSRTQEQWPGWKRCFTDRLAINEMSEDAQNLTFLRSYAGSELLTILRQTATFEATAIVDAEFEKPSRFLMYDFKCYRLNKATLLRSMEKGGEY